MERSIRSSLEPRDVADLFVIEFRADRRVSKQVVAQEVDLVLAEKDLIRGGFVGEFAGGAADAVGLIAETHAVALSDGIVEIASGMVDLQGADTAAEVLSVRGCIDGANELGSAGRRNPVAIDLIAAEAEQVLAVIPEVSDVVVEWCAGNPIETTVGTCAVSVEIVLCARVWTDEVGDVDIGYVGSLCDCWRRRSEKAGGKHGCEGERERTQHGELL